MISSLYLNPQKKFSFIATDFLLFKLAINVNVIEDQQENHFGPILINVRVREFVIGVEFKRLKKAANSDTFPGNGVPKVNSHDER